MSFKEHDFDLIEEENPAFAGFSWFLLLITCRILYTKCMKNKKKFKIGNVSDFSQNKGWFFGHFTDDELLKSDLVEIAWQNISKKLPLKEDKHLHQSSVEINIVIAGKIKNNY
jgi:hypothetical protein